MEMWQVWLLVKLDSIVSTAHVCLIVTCIISGVLALFYPLIRLELRNQEAVDSMALRILKRNVLPLITFCTLLIALVPTTKEAAVIIAVPAIMESRVVKEDIPEVYDLAVEWAKEKLGKPANTKVEQ